MRTAAVLLSSLLLPFTGTAFAQAKPTSGTITVYRCTDAGGTQSLRNTPCPKGQKQQVREMLRPQDAPPRPPAAPTPPKPAPAPTVVVETVYLAPPRPMYECTTPEGDRYTSEDGQGNPRWVPLWTLGYYAVGRPTGSSASSAPRPSSPPSGSMRPPHAGGHWPAVGAGGTWIRDQCAMLPPREACDRLRDRRDAIRTRFFNAQEKERDTLRTEERGINARLDDDCGGR